MPGVVPEGGAIPGSYDGSSVLMNPKNLTPLNKIEDVNKYKNILSSMQESGYQGRPILAYMDKGKAKALTGSHRLYAARSAGIDVPVVFVKPSVMKWEDNEGLFGTFKESINDQRVYEHLKAAGDDTAASLAKLEDQIYQPTGMLGPAKTGVMAVGRAGERFAERAVPQIMERGGMGAEMLQGMSRGTVSPLDETFAGFATPEQYNAAKFYGQNQTERWPAAWAKSGAVTPEEILRQKGIVQPPPTQRDKDLYLLESRFSGFMDASKARQFLENDMLKATKKEKDLLKKYYDASGRFIPREELPVQQQNSLNSFMR